MSVLLIFQVRLNWCVNHNAGGLLMLLSLSLGGMPSYTKRKISAPLCQTKPL